MGSGKTSSQQFRTRDPEPQELTNLRLGLYGKVMPGLESFSAEDWTRARDTATSALNQQNALLGQLSGQLGGNNALVGEIANIARTGNIPSTLAANMNASVNQELQSSMGSMLNSLGNRGVLNSSITSQGVQNLASNAADAYNRNYLNAYQAVLGGLGSALQGQQANTSALMTGINALGKIPEQAYEGAGAALTPALNLWRLWQNSYDTRQDYDTVVTQKQGSCITGDTLLRLSDGRELPVSELEETDKIQAWDFERGCITSAPLAAFFRRHDKADGFDVIRVEFEDGTSIGVIREHLFYDMAARKFVSVNAGSLDYVGHEFASVNREGEVRPLKVSRIYSGGKATESYAPQVEGHLNFIANGFITGNDGQLGLCNRYEFEADSLKYDAEKKDADLKKYGRLEYEELDGIISEEFYENNHVGEFSVAIGKGLMTLDELRGYLRMYAFCFLE